MQKDLVFQGILPQLQPNRNMRHVGKHHENRVWTEIYSGLMAGKLVADQPKETLNKRTIDLHRNRLIFPKCNHHQHKNTS